MMKAALAILQRNEACFSSLKYNLINMKHHWPYQKFRWLMKCWCKLKS